MKLEWEQCNKKNVKRIAETPLHFWYEIGTNGRLWWAEALDSEERIPLQGGKCLWSCDTEDEAVQKAEEHWEELIAPIIAPYKDRIEHLVHRVGDLTRSKEDGIFVPKDSELYGPVKDLVQRA